MTGFLWALAAISLLFLVAGGVMWLVGVYRDAENLFVGGFLTAFVSLVIFGIVMASFPDDRVDVQQSSTSSEEEWLAGAEQSWLDAHLQVDNVRFARGPGRTCIMFVPLLSLPGGRVELLSVDPSLCDGLPHTNGDHSDFER